MAGARAGRRSFAVKRNTVILLVSNFSSAAFGLALAILIARGAGDAALGAYSLALAWSLTLAQVADLGMNTLLTRDLAREPQHTTAYLRASLLAKTIIGLILTLGLILAASALTPDAASARSIQLGAALVLVNAWYASFTAIFRAFGRMLSILILNVGGLAIQLLVTWVLVGRGANIDALIGLAVLIQALQLGGAWMMYARHERPDLPGLRDREGFGLAYVWKLTRAGLPFALAGILGSLELRANLFLLGAMDGDRAVGWYSAASRLVDGVRLAPNAFFGAMLPALAAVSSIQGQKIFRRAQWGLFAFGLGVALFFSLAAPLLIETLYGHAFATAIPTLILLGWSLIPTLGVGILTLWFYARGHERAVNFFLCGALLLHFLAALLLVPIASSVGAAGASLFSDSALWCGMLVYAARLKK